MTRFSNRGNVPLRVANCTYSGTAEDQALGKLILKQYTKYIMTPGVAETSWANFKVPTLCRLPCCLLLHCLLPSSLLSSSTLRMLLSVTSTVIVFYCAAAASACALMY